MKQILKRKQVSHVRCLKNGDRFYFKRDNGKQIWQYIRPDVYFFRGQKKMAAVCKNDLGKESRFDGNRLIVYLNSSSKSNGKQIFNNLRLFEGN